VTLSPGDQLASLTTQPIRPQAMAEMAVVLADPNPIHLDAAVVQDLGLGERQVVQGPITIGFILEMLRRALPDAHLELLEVRYLSNAFAWDRVRVTGSVDEVEVDASGRRLRCAVVAEIVGQKGHVAVGTATLTLGGSAGSTSR
jgi:acyl dehydratase